MRHLLTVPKLISVGFHHAHFMGECWEASAWAVLSWIKGNTAQSPKADGKEQIHLFGTNYMAGTGRYYN